MQIFDDRFNRATERVLLPREEQALNSLCFQMKKLVSERTRSPEILWMVDQVIADIRMEFPCGDHTADAVTLENSREHAIAVLKEKAKRVAPTDFKTYLRSQYSFFERITGFLQIKQDYGHLCAFRRLAESLQ